MRTAPYVLVTYSALSLADGKEARRALHTTPARADVQRAAAAMTEAGAASFGVDEVVVWLRAHGNERARESVREALQDDVTSVLGTTARLRPGVYALRRPGRGPGRANADARRHCADALLEAADRLLGDGPPEVTRAQVVAEMGAAGALFSARAITAGLARLLSSGRLARTGHGRYRRAGAA